MSITRWINLLKMNTCPKVQNLEDFMILSKKNNVDDEIEDDTIPLRSITPKETLFVS